VAGPTTYRPNVTVGEAAERMGKRGVPAILVTTSDGRLMGQLYREDAERQTENLRTSEKFPSSTTSLITRKPVEASFLKGPW